MARVEQRRKRSTQTLHRISYRAGLGVGVLLAISLLSSLGEEVRKPGPIMVGHQEIACSDCHRPARGSLRQQLQSQVSLLLGNSDQADFGASEVGNKDCVACHGNDKDRHATHRFLEPRFSKQRASIRPHRCVSCHSVHGGKRVSMKLEFCQHCHADLSLPNDKAEPSHETLVADENWVSCLGCHDYHGNHKMQVQGKLEYAIQEETLRRYFAGGMSPYPDERFVKAKKKR